jgi:Holliday junction DNA helicase RuvA
MISSLRGKLLQKTPTRLVIDVNGVGYSINIPLSSYQRIGAVGSELYLLTYLHVREDILQLYGFTTEEERELFQMLIAISGIGPKLAQSILSGISVEDFKQAIVNNDVDVLITISGIGRKTAQRLMVELKEKFGDVGGDFSVVTPPKGVDVAFVEEAILALVSLGFKKVKAKTAVQKVLEKGSGTLPLEEVIKRALRYT